ncbi:DnaJ C-terminal domain-containing protein [Embleya hyalina]|uniref:Chaperone protein DnaJ 2 n=1 Tax=Embleya hyalina TaxID=516124 RepID=A0A401YTJ7_9ACTN|nr:DnaJ C-terminal domain-containing protein [Embleya hyalina]GCD97902.1 chaperone protein DnaJ 2 [Embleya hyalina]
MITDAERELGAFIRNHPTDNARRGRVAVVALLVGLTLAAVAVPSTISVFTEDPGAAQFVGLLWGGALIGLWGGISGGLRTVRRHDEVFVLREGGLVCRWTGGLRVLPWTAIRCVADHGQRHILARAMGWDVHLVLRLRGGGRLVLTGYTQDADRLAARIEAAVAAISAPDREPPHHGSSSDDRRGDDALIRIPVQLEEVVLGTIREIRLDSAVVCPLCDGERVAPGTARHPCAQCSGNGRVRTRPGRRSCLRCTELGTTVPDPCEECAGEGRVRVLRTLTFKIPGGVDTGTRIQLKGDGEVGPGGGPAGDLYIEVSVEPHAVFRRRGDDLHCTVEVSAAAAAHGTTVPLQTFDSDEATGDDTRVEIPPGTRHLDDIRLPGLGVTHLRGGGRGDVVATVHILDRR